MGDKVNALNAQSGETGKGDAAPCVVQSVSGDIAHTLKAEGADASEDGTGRGTPIIGFQTRGRNIDIGPISGTIGTNADRASGSAPMIAHVVAPPLTATNDPSRSPQSAEVTAQVEAVLRAQYPEAPVVPYDLLQVTEPRNFQNRDENSPCHTLAKENAAHAGVVHPAVHFDVYNHKTTGDVCGVVREQHGTNMNAVLQPTMSVRRLTPVECERLQGFPDNHTRIPWKGKPASDCPDGPRYRALGNSMAVPVIAWIGRKIDTALKR